MDKSDNYVCKGCGHVFPKKGVSISGWPDHMHGRHVHCPVCGDLVAAHVKGLQ